MHNYTCTCTCTRFVTCTCTYMYCVVHTQTMCSKGPRLWGQVARTAHYYHSIHMYLHVHVVKLNKEFLPRDPSNELAYRNLFLPLDLAFQKSSVQRYMYFIKQIAVLKLSAVRCGSRICTCEDALHDILTRTKAAGLDQAPRAN